MVKNSKKGRRDLTTEGAGRSSTRSQAILALLLGTVSGLFFAAMGAWIGLRPMGHMLYAAWEVRSWQPSPIEVLEATLDAREDRKGRTVYAVQARYRYEFAGQTHESTRVGLDSSVSSDNLGQWHQRWSERLQAARDGGPRLLAWVNPRRPEQALLDRQLRWPLLLLLTPFALIFPLVGVGLLVGCGRALWARLRSAPPRHPPQRDALALATARLTPRHRTLVHWVVAIFWCGGAFPAAGVFIHSQTPIWVRLFCSIFVLVGLVLLWEALRQTWSAWRYSGSRLHGRPVQPRAGVRHSHRNPATPDRFARKAGLAPDQPIPTAPSDERRPELPPGVRWSEGSEASVLAFAQKGWRWTGLLALLLVGGLALAGRGDEDAGLSGALLGQAVLLTLGLHGLSRRWTLQVRDDGVLLQRQSWIWESRTVMPASALDPLYHRLQYSRQQAGWSEEFHALYTRWPGRGHGTRLSPALPGGQGAEALAQFLRWAAAQRRGRFSAGALREKRAARSGPAWGLALVPLLLWLLQRN